MLIVCLEDEVVDEWKVEVMVEVVRVRWCLFVDGGGRR
jgi:hypothetical protein